MSVTNRLMELPYSAGPLKTLMDLPFIVSGAAEITPSRGIHISVEDFEQVAITNGSDMCD